MSTEDLRILIFEDEEADAEMALRQLRQDGFECTAERVGTEAEFLAALRQPTLDLILADHALSCRDGQSALAVAQKERPEVPFIVVSGTMGEETAINALHQGATDYVLKHQLSRLAPAVRRALRECEVAREKKRAEDSLKLFRTLIDQSNDAVEVIDPDTARFLDVNARSCLDLGYSREEFLSLRVFDVDPRVSPGKFRQVIGELRKSGSTTWQGIHQRKNGTTFPVEVNLKYTQIDRDYVVAVVRDVTERKRAEEALAREQFLLRCLMDHLPDLIYFKDKESRFVRINRAAAIRFGLTDPVQALGKTDFDFFTEEHARLAFEDEQAILRTGQPLVNKEERETWLNHPDTWVSTTKLPLRDEAGAIVGTFGISRDITERKQNEEALLQRFELQEQLARIAATVPGTIFSFRMRPDGSVSVPYASSNLDDGLGLSADDLREDASPALALIHPDDLQGVRKAMAESAENLTPWRQEFRLRHKLMGEIWAEAHSVPRREPDGSVLWHGFVQDISARKCAEEMMRDSRSFLEKAQEVGHLGSWSSGLSPGDPLTWSSEVYRIFGVSEGEFDGRVQSFFSLVHPEDRERVEQASHAAIEEGTPFDLEHRILRPDGAVRWVHEKGEVVRDSRGLPVQMLGVVQDITDRKRAEEQLNLQSAALDAAANAAIITDRNGTILWVNPAFTATSGYPLAEALGKNPRDLVKSGEHDEAFYRDLWTTILAGNVWHGEIINRRKDGKHFTQELTIPPVRNERAEITHFIAIGQDVTEKKLLEERFLRAQRLESVGRLAGGIAHDLNNILAPLLMMPPLLRQALPKGQPQRLVDTIETNALRGVDIIKQMLLFSRGMAGKHVPVPLRSLLRDMLKIIRETFPKNITARSQISGELDTVSGDATQLQQVLMNLCVNARDAMPSGGTLTLGLESMDVDEAFAQTGASVTPGRYVVLTVTDTGTGIPPEVRDKIFDPFFTTKQVGQGTGLGLSTVLGIARGHNGFVEVKSEPGQGTQFRVCLPACQLAAAGGAPPKPGPLMQGQGELVLVVDDEDEVRHVTRTILERNGYRVAEAHDGVEALTFLVSGAETVQAVLTDLMMPHMDGPAFIRALPYTKTSAKVVATTGDISKLECLDELKKHVQAFLPKPFRAAELLETLARVLHA